MILRLKSPRATAVVTSAMLRTWAVRLPAIELTLSVRSFQVPATPRHHRLAAELAFGADLARHARHFAGEAVELVHHGVDGVFELQDFAAHVHGDLLDKSPLATAVVTSAMLRTWPVRLPAIEFTLSVRSFQVPATPGTLAWPPSLPSVPTSRATRVTSPAKALSWSTIVLTVSLSCRISPDTFTVIFFDRSPPAMAVATSAMLRTCDVRLPAMELTLSVRSFQVPATPGTAAWPPSLPSVPTSRATRVTSRGEGVELVHHGVDGVFQLQDFALHVHGDLARQVAARHGGRHLRDVADLRGQVAGQQIDVVGEVLPGAGDAGHDRLAAELAVGADLAGDARHFRGERAELVHHRVDGFLELKDFAAHVHGDLLGQVAVGHRDGHVGDVADLARQVGRHRVHAFGQVLPHAGHFRHLRLAAELALGADLARHARHLGREHAELLDHGVDDVRRLQKLALQRAAIDVEVHGLQAGRPAPPRRWRGSLPWSATAGRRSEC